MVVFIIAFYSDRIGELQKIIVSPTCTTSQLLKQQRVVNGIKTAYRICTTFDYNHNQTLLSESQQYLHLYFTVIITVKLVCKIPMYSQTQNSAV